MEQEIPRYEFDSIEDAIAFLQVWWAEEIDQADEEVDG